VRWSNLDVLEDRRARLPGYRDEAVVRHFDAPEALETRFYEIRARSIINRVPEVSQVPFRWTINPYRGCTHACIYCFARPTHDYLGFNPGRDFEREIVVKVNAPERLAAELARPSWKGEHIALGTNTDPYQWVEGRYKLMRGIWTALRDARNPCSVLTKSPLLLRDLDLMRELNACTEFSAALSVPTLDELTKAGIRTGVLVAPLMPGINDAPEQVEPILEAVAEAGAAYVSGIGLHLRRGVRDVFMQWLAQERPDLMERYALLYPRGAYLPMAERRRLGALIRGPDLPAGMRMRGRFEAPEPSAQTSEKRVQETLF
jgi:DNA repair photolyase